MLSNFDLTDTTAEYRSPPLRPVTVPPAADCTPEQLLDLAAASAQDRDTLWSLLGSADHVQAICELLAARVEPALRQADKDCEELQTRHAHEIRGLQLQLAESQSVVATLQDRLETQTDLVFSHLQEAVRLQGRLANLSNELAVTRHAMAALAHSRHLLAVTDVG
jgi:septal ring factor EnvC (AmiA/AmiB activator)